MRRIISLAAIIWAILATTALSQIEVPATIESGKPIVCTVNLQGVPDGAVLKGAVSPDVPGADVLPGPTGNVFHIWAKPGTYDVEVLGMWGVAHPTAEGAWSDFGFFRYRAKFTVTGGGPDPGPNPPDPPPPGGKWQMLFLHKADQLDNLPQAQRDLLTSLVVRQELASQGHAVLAVLPDNALGGSVAEKLRPFIAAVKDTALPVVVMAPIAGGKLKVYPLPPDYQALQVLIGGAQ